MASLTWLGHASFRLDTSDGKRFYVDPFPSGPTWPDAERSPERADAIAVTHGHGDHSADVPGLQQTLGCPVLGMVELMGWYSANGIDEANLIAFNKGGTVEVAGARFTMTNAFHSSSAPDGSYAGEAAGFCQHLVDHLFVEVAVKPFRQRGFQAGGVFERKSDVGEGRAVGHGSS